MNKNLKWIFTALGLPLCMLASAQVRLPRLVRDSMILQRDVPVKLWGWASPGEKLKIKFNGKTYSATTNKDGRWTLSLSPLKAGGPYTMQIDASNHLVLKDILVGDVWLCSGQSNMVHQMVLHRERYAADIAEAHYPQIRHFWIPTSTALGGPQEDLAAGYWKSANPEDVLQFSAVAYFFARQIYEAYKIPIGLINASVGGTPIQAWISEEGLKSFPAINSTLTKNKDTAYINSLMRRIAQAGASQRPPVDEGLSSKPAWFSTEYQPADWRPAQVPGYWEDQGMADLNGTVWYRREIDLPAEVKNRKAMLALGRIVDADEVYLNGKLVGRTTYQYPQRRYQLEAGMLKPGKNLLVVRVSNFNSKGGFVPDKPYYLAFGQDTVDLKGLWQYKVGSVFVPQFPGESFSAQNSPTALYNAMVAPLVPYAIKGVLWYQGEANTGNPKEYEALMPALINDWRRLWSKSDLPFLYVQLPNFMDTRYLPSESQWAATREAQRKTLSVPNTGMAVTIDLGEWNDIHPDRKKEVGERLALLAKDIAYQDHSGESSGPLFDSLRKDGDQLIISFRHAGSGLTTKDGNPPAEFAIAGADKKFYWAKARIENGAVVVWNENIHQPVYVRYAWADNPFNPNLYNREGLPASPFEAKLGGTISGGPWQNKKSAVVLTYDDGLNVHLSNAVPALDSFGLKGTFYISDYFNGLSAQINGWRRAAMNGHELANHTVNHPCAGSLPGRSFVNWDYDLDRYTVRRMRDEILTMNKILQAIDGKTRRTFAYPCGDKKIHDTVYIDGLRNELAAARGVSFRIVSAAEADLFDLPCYTVNGQSGDQLIQQVKSAMDKQGLLVFLFHGVGGEHSLNVSLPAHRQLLQFLKDHEDEIWIAPMIEVADYIRAQQKK